MSHHKNQLTDLCNYCSSTFSILCNGVTLDVFNKDNVLIESIDIAGKSDDDVDDLFEQLKTKYIFDYDNKL
jgi:hypothetical protein